MTSQKRAVVIAAVGAVAAALLIYGLRGYFSGGARPPAFEGWVEAELIFVSPDETGRIEKLSVREGDEVSVNAPIFALDDDLQRAAVAENEAGVANARVTFERAQELLKRAVGSQKTYDDAEAALRSAQARLNSAKTRLERRRIASPVTGTVQEVYFRGGELVQAGRPIVSILPPGNVKVRFFVPQVMLPTVHIGDHVLIRCDGCVEVLVARISFISAQAEFTPPVIYSQEERSRLVFRIEARPEKPKDMRVGQPVTVALQAGAASHAEK